MVEEVRKEFKEAYQPWDKEADNELKQILGEGLNAKDAAKHLGKTIGAIRSRKKKQEVQMK